MIDRDWQPQSCSHDSPGTATYLRVCRRALTFTITKGSNIMIFRLLFLLGVVWNDKVCFLTAICVLIEYQLHCVGLVDDATEVCVCVHFLAMFVYQLIHLLWSAWGSNISWVGLELSVVLESRKSDMQKSTQHLRLNLFCFPSLTL